MSAGRASSLARFASPPTSARPRRWVGEAPPPPICATTSGRYPSPGPNRRGSQPPTFSHTHPPHPPAAELTDVPLDGNLPEAFLEAGVEGAGGAAAVPLGGGGHGGAEREHSGLPAAPAHFKSPASRWAGWPPPPSPPNTPREEAEALPPPPPRRAAGRSCRCRAAAARRAVTKRVFGERNGAGPLRSGSYRKAVPHAASICINLHGFSVLLFELQA